VHKALPRKRADGRCARGQVNRPASVLVYPVGVDQRES
jgi:hypothetical protein